MRGPTEPGWSPEHKVTHHLRANDGLLGLSGGPQRGVHSVHFMVQALDPTRSRFGDTFRSCGKTAASPRAMAFKDHESSTVLDVEGPQSGREDAPWLFQPQLLTRPRVLAPQQPPLGSLEPV